MPTTVSSDILAELGRLICDACQRGDNVSAIAERSGVSRKAISQIKNGTYSSSPSVEMLASICHSIGHRLSFQKSKL